MGVSYSTALMYGVPYTTKSVGKTVTKYHEDTGEPYDKKVTEDEEHLTYRDGNTLTVVPGFEDDDDLHDEFLDFKMGQGKGAVGITIADLWCDNQDTGCVDVDTHVMQKAHNEFVEMAIKYFGTDKAQKIINEARLMLVDTTDW